MEHRDPRYFSPHVFTTHLAAALLGAIIGALIILHTIIAPLEIVTPQDDIVDRTQLSHVNI